MMTLQQLNQHAAQLEQDGLLDEKGLTAAADDGDLMSKICGVYKKVRPFLEVITTLWFIPKKWATPIISLMAIMDGICPDLELSANG